jgi:hypothetical protein
MFGDWGCGWPLIGGVVGATEALRLKDEVGAGVEPPLRGMDGRPFGLPGVNEETFVVSEDMGEHQADEGGSIMTGGGAEQPCPVVQVFRGSNVGKPGLVHCQRGYIFRNGNSEA